MILLVIVTLAIIAAIAIIASFNQANISRKTFKKIVKAIEEQHKVDKIEYNVVINEVKLSYFIKHNESNFRVQDKDLVIIPPMFNSFYSSLAHLLKKNTIERLNS